MIRGRMRAPIAALALVLWVVPASAWVLTLQPGPKQLFLMVGNGVAFGNATTINTVSAVVPAANVGNGVAQPMTSDSSQSTSPYDGFSVCNPPGQIYVGGSYRQPDSTTGAASATLQVSTPAALSSGTDTIAFSQISWTSTANGNSAADIPAGTFTGGAQFLANIGRNNLVENCFTYSYANRAVVPAGTFTGRATFTLSVP